MKINVDVNVQKLILQAPDIFKWDISVCECMSGGIYDAFSVASSP